MRRRGRTCKACSSIGWRRARTRNWRRYEIPRSLRDKWRGDDAGNARYNTSVEKTARVFASFEDADKADARYDESLSPEERLRILIELRDRRHPDAAEQRLARVSRVVELQRQ